MKIAFFTHCLPSRDSHGAAETCYSIIKFLKSQNHEIILNIIADDNEYNLSHNNSAQINNYCKKKNIYKIPKKKKFVKKFFN